jgi:hypothetical protein
MGSMSLRREDVDRLLAPNFVEGLVDAAVDEIRTNRAQCRRVEDLMSYLRRVVQGQIDVVTAERAMREHGTRGDHQHRLVEDLPSILAGSPTSGRAGPELEAGGMPGNGRQATSLLAMSAVSEVFAEESDLAPDEIAAVMPAGLAELTFSGSMLPGANLESFANTELDELVVRLREYEALLSAERRILHERIDQLQSLVVKRYKSGAADSDALLGDHDMGPGLDADIASHSADPADPVDPEDDSP